VSTVPAEIAGIGSTQQRLRVYPAFDRMKVGSSEEYFVLDRIDGKQSLREVLLATGLPVDRAIKIVQRLRTIGALLLPGESQPPPPPAPPPERQSGSQTAVPRTLTPMNRVPAATGPIHDLTLPNATPDELEALAEDVELTDTERRRVLAMARLAELRDPSALLGIPAGTDARTVKLAYFELSKEVHPDRYYGKRRGSFERRMSVVFEAMSRAYAQLTGGERARASGSHSYAPAAADEPQTKQEYAAELFDRACQLEVGGNAMDAMKQFAAAVQVDPQARYLRRAANCALLAHQPKVALEYAKKAQALAPNDPSAARLLATAFRAAGRLGDAEEVLVMAMAIKSENDVLANELRNDLAEVRRLLSQ
jgi:tetratricopeptide (TPR) repeat protein